MSRLAHPSLAGRAWATACLAAILPLAAHCQGSPLFKAIAAGDQAAAAIAIRQGTDINAADPSGQTPLVAEVRRMTTLLSVGPSDLAFLDLLLASGADPNLGSPLAEARDSAEVIERLLAKGADPNAASGGNGSPLLSAFLSSADATDARIALDLLKYGADPRRNDAKGVPPIVEASGSSTIKVVQELLDRGADPGARAPSFPSSALAAALDSGHLDIARRLLSLGREMGLAADADALMAAAGTGIEWVQALEAHGLPLGTRDRKGRSALHAATDFDTVRYLVDRGLDPNARDDRGSTPLQRASRSGSLESVRYLVDHGALLEIPDEYGETALWQAMERYDMDDAIPLYLLGQGAQAEVASSDPFRQGYTPLWIAVLQGRLDLARKLLASGARADARVAVPLSSEIGDEPLESVFLGNLGSFLVFERALTDAGKLDLAAAKREHYREMGLVSAMWTAAPRGFGPAEAAQASELLSALLAKGAEVPLATRDAEARGGLGWAATWAGENALQSLVAGGCDPALKDARGETPPELALESGNLGAIRFFARRSGGRLPLSRVDGKSALHLACTSGSAEALDYLLSLGLDPNLRDGVGWTPLHQLADSPPKDKGILEKMVRSLLAAGAVYERSDEGQFPIGVAEARARADGADSSDEVPFRAALFAAALGDSRVVGASGAILRDAPALSGARIGQATAGSQATILGYAHDSLVAKTGGDPASIVLPFDGRIMNRYADWIRVSTDIGEGWTQGASIATWFGAAISGLELLNGIPQYYLGIEPDAQNGRSSAPIRGGVASLLELRPLGDADSPLPRLVFAEVASDGIVVRERSLRILSVHSPSSGRLELSVEREGDAQAGTVDLGYDSGKGSLSLVERDANGEGPDESLWIDTELASRISFALESDDGADGD